MANVTVRNLPDAATAYGDLRARAREAGRAIGTADGYTAAIAVARGLTVATRDAGPFRAAGLTIINPWETSGRSV